MILKRISSLMILIFMSLSCVSCSLIFAALDHSSVEPFGNVHFAETGLIGCVNWLYDGDDLYYFVAVLDCDVEYDQALGAFNDDGHGYTFYSLKGEEYSGITVLETKSMIDTIKYVYASEKIESVPCSLLFDVPHLDSWLDGGYNFTLNDVKYSKYYSTEPNAFEKGEEIGTVDNTTYYKVPGYDEWICSVNESDNTRLNMCYDVNMKNLPMYFVILANPMPSK